MFKYSNKSFILTLKRVSNKGKYQYKYNADINIKDCIVVSLFNNQEIFEEDNTLKAIPSSEVAIMQDTPFFVRVVIHSAKDLSSGQASHLSKVSTFAQDFLINDELEKAKIEKNDDTEAQCLPLINVTLTDKYIDSLYDEEYDPTKFPSELSRSYQIMDSSIWNYIIPLAYGEYGGKDRFLEIIDTIYQNYQRGLYNLAVSKEYADLNARLACASFLSGAHATGVSPFIFHSESAIDKMIKNELDGPRTIKTQKRDSITTTQRIKGQKWRILLIDDKAKEELVKSPTNTTAYSKDKSLPWNCKLTIIMNVLSDFIGNDEKFPLLYREFNENKTDVIKRYKGEKITDESNSGILIEYVQSAKNAHQALKKNKYDIILLDYLLDFEKDTFHYGYELLDAIFKEINDKTDDGGNVNFDNISYQIGPHERLFFIFISAYSTAVYERLLAEGLNRSEKYWHIAVGACPTNTPKLFLYNLLKLMEKQLEDSGVDKLSPRGIFDIVNKIYGSAEGEDIGKSVRYRANKYYQKVLDLHYLYRKMLDDVDFPANESNSIFNTKGSVLITNFMKKNVNLGGLLEHLTQLVHLTAFGTVRQWPEMWEEYIYFKAQFNITQLEIDCDKQNWNAREHFNTLCVNIENHILDLKSDVK